MVDGRLLCIVGRAWLALPVTLQAQELQQADTQGLQEQLPCWEVGDCADPGHLALLLRIRIVGF